MIDSLRAVVAAKERYQKACLLLREVREKHSVTISYPSNPQGSDKTWKAFEPARRELETAAEAWAEACTTFRDDPESQEQSND